MLQICLDLGRELDEHVSGGCFGQSNCKGVCKPGRCKVLLTVTVSCKSLFDQAKHAR